MVDRDLLLAKSACIRAHIDRIAAKSGKDLQTFTSDVDRQDIVAFNAYLASLLKNLGHHPRMTG